MLKNLTGVLLFCLSGSALAIPVNFFFEGIIDEADDGNAFGLNEDDLVQVTGMFDADFPLDGDVEFGDGTGNMMTLQLGSIFLFETNDERYLDGIFPTLEFIGGLFAGLNFIAEPGVNGAPVEYEYDSISDFEAEDENDREIEGFWILESFVVTPKAVPLPDTLSLFLLGLLGLGVCRKLPVRV